MHSHDIWVDDVCYIAHVNGDFSGNVKVNIPANLDPRRLTMPELHHTGSGQTPYWTIEIPFEVMTELVGREVRSELIRQLEDLSGREVIASARRPGM